MGICPLSAWGHSTVKTMGRAVWKPIIASLVALVVVIILGVRQPGALLGFWLVAFVGFVILFEFGRATLARHRKTGENLPLSLWRLVGKNRRRYGGALIHLSIILMALGIIGIEMFQTETQGSIQQGGQLTLGSYVIRYDDLQTQQVSAGYEKTTATISVYKNNRFVGKLYPRRDYYYDAGQTVTTPGLRSTLEDDLYVVLVDWEAISTEGATFKVYRNPLVIWLWLGAIVLIAGTLVAGWPERQAEAMVAPAAYVGVKA
jgi:cytochrome c-type biogenesis protein CcmF